MALHDLTDSEHKIVHAYNVSGRSCRISRVGNYRSYMPSRHQEGTSGSQGFETPDRTCLLDVRTALHDLTGSEHKIVHATYKVSGRGCKISRVRNTRSYMHRMYQEGAAGSHGYGTSDRKCLLDIRTGLQGLTGSDQQIQHSYKVSDRGCRILRVRHIRSNLPTWYQVGVAGSHWLGTTDRTCLLGIRRGLQDLTGSKHRSNVPITGKCQDGVAWSNGLGAQDRTCMPTRYPDGTARSYGFGTPDRTCLEGIRKAAAWSHG